MEQEPVVGISVKEIYGNYKVLHPDGSIMFYGTEKRANWYLSRKLANRIDDKTIQLTFKPKGNGESSKFENGRRKNICVVSGVKENLSKHHVVPHHIRKFLPGEYKNSNSFDVLIVERKLHDEYETHAAKFKNELYDKYITKEEIEFDRKLKVAKKIHNLISPPSPNMPDSVIVDKSMRLKEMLKDLDLHICDLDTVQNMNKPKLLVERMGYENIIIAWKEHFVKTMNPKYLPKWWDPTYIKKLKGVKIKMNVNDGSLVDMQEALKLSQELGQTFSENFVEVSTKDMTEKQRDNSMVSLADHTSTLGRKLTEERRERKLGRNDLCRCGSGLKYKKCCLK